MHVIELAPTREIRETQNKIDLEHGTMKRDREVLGSTFVSEYKHLILDNYNLEAFMNLLISEDSKKLVLFCVEKNHEACHRSIVAKEIENKYNLKSIHL